MVVRKILCVIGTRPEAIKMAPIILALRKECWVSVRILATAQHREMLDQTLSFFDIKADIDLNIMTHNQSITTLTAKILLDLDNVLQVEKPDVVLVQGDTTTAMVVALASFYQHIPIGHVEAGFRTMDTQDPFPEEINRTIIARLAKWHFAPTVSARDNLLKEGISDGDIFVTGNSVIDALLMTASRDPDIGIQLAPDKRIILVTVHRRESFGQPLRNICQALVTIAVHNPDIQIICPVHPNPNVKNTVHEILGAIHNIILCPPLDYAAFIAAMKKAYIIISDSGGVQEEAPALGKPVLVIREKTERFEAIDKGVAKLIGSDYSRIVTEIQQLLDDERNYSLMALGESPYGDGFASERITQILKENFDQCS